MALLKLIAATTTSAAAFQWVTGGSGPAALCAGIFDPCSDITSCTTVAYGPCGSGNSPPFYIQSQIIGLSLVPATGNSTILTSSTIPNNGYRTFSADEVVGNAHYAFMSAGMYVGDNPTVSGGYVGMANYIMKNGTISTNVNNFYVPDDIGLSTASMKTACISPLDSSGNCGENKTYNPADYKFSLFGFTTGSSFTLPQGTQYLGIRTQLVLVNGPQVDIAFNGDPTMGLEGPNAIGDADVTSFTLYDLSGSGFTVNVTMPQEYNVGSFSNHQANTPSSTRNVHIKASMVNSTSMYLDYLFNISDIQSAGQYFVYDPTVNVADNQTLPANLVTSTTAQAQGTTSASGTSTSTGSNSSTAAATSGSGTTQGQSTSTTAAAAGNTTTKKPTASLAARFDGMKVLFWIAAGAKLCSDL